MTQTATNDQKKKWGADDYQPPCKRASDVAGGCILQDGTPAKVLCSGIDTLYLTCDVEWLPTAFMPGGIQTTKWFKRLREDKERASHEKGTCYPDVIRCDEFPAWQFNVAAYGMGGYAFMLNSRHMTWKLGDWMTPCSRPSLMIELRAETLWTFGVKECMRWIRAIIQTMGGVVQTMKPSRMDMCVDVLIHKNEWKTGIIEKAITRTRDFQIYLQHRKLTGIGFGGKTSKLNCRLYDKVKEIENASGKYWMFDVWGIKPEDVTDDYRVIRVEFQIMREKLKEMQIGTMADVYQREDQVWSYLTRKWLQIVNRIDKRDRRQDAGWWQVVQRGYKGSQLACPLIPAKAVRRDKLQLKAQFDGMLISHMACNAGDIEDGGPITKRAALLAMAEEYGDLDEDISDDIRGRQAKYARDEMKIQESLAQRSYQRIELSPVGPYPRCPELEPLTGEQLEF